MPSLYCLYETLLPSISSRIEHLQTACEKLNIDFILLNSLTCSYNTLPVLSKKDLLYNIGRGSKNLESLLLNESVTTFYITNPSYIQPDSIKSAMVHMKSGIAMPKTVFDSTNDRKKLKHYVESCLGFPVVIKISGGTLGVGTMIANDFQSLFSLADFLVSVKVRFMLQQFIKPKEIARLIVIGNKVIASNQKFIAEDDFRTSVMDKLPLQKEYSKTVQELAILASHLLNFENSGVDIIIDENDIPYLLEVNMPHDFVTTAKVTKINIAAHMIEHLINKSANE